MRGFECFTSIEPGRFSRFHGTFSPEVEARSQTQAGRGRADKGIESKKNQKHSIRRKLKGFRFGTFERWNVRRLTS